jgi:peptidoglycan/LPS O-acetylase OafA/YrhL
VFLAGIAGFLKKPRLMAFAIIAYLALWLLVHFVHLPIPGKLMQTHRLSLPFVLGMALWLWRDHVPLSLPIAAALGLLSWLTYDTVAGYPLFILWLGYAVFWLAYVPKGRVRLFNRLGDYSYGIYIYAFPLQGLAIWLFGPMSPLTNILISFPLVLFCSVLSWRFVEAPALALAHRGKSKRAKVQNSARSSSSTAR